MNSPEHEHEPIERRAHKLWREAAHHLDASTTARLRAARREALQPSTAPQRQAVRWLIPTGALAAMALAVMMVWQPLPHTHAPSANQAASSAPQDVDNELPPDAEQVDPGLYQNLDFYAWLAANDRHPTSR
jgi:ferric-dicitrate binding protein FerR (iron transport regulator)